MGTSKNACTHSGQAEVAHCAGLGVMEVIARGGGEVTKRREVYSTNGSEEGSRMRMKEEKIQLR